MRIGVFSFGAESLDAQIQQVVQAENDGLDSFWFVQLSDVGYDALTTLAQAGRVTDRIELGTGVVPIYPRHPLTLAQQAATAQVTTQGRLTLGIGLSHRIVVEDIMGLSYERPASTMQEYLSILRALVDQGQVDFSGEQFTVKADFQVPGTSPFPILVAALAPRMLQIAGELADGTITWMVGEKTLKTHIVPRINAAAQSVGRPQPRICVILPIAVTEDRAGARQHVADTLAIYGQLPNYRRMLDIEEAAGPADVAIIGTEDEVGDQLQTLAQAGASDFIASILPIDEDTVARTRAFLKSLNSR